MELLLSGDGAVIGFLLATAATGLFSGALGAVTLIGAGLGLTGTFLTVTAGSATLTSALPSVNLFVVSFTSGAGEEDLTFAAFAALISDSLAA